MTTRCRPADGLRQPRLARPGRGVLHRHPPRAARRRRTCSRSCWTATARSAAGRRCRGSWRSSGRRSRPSSPPAARPIRVYAGMRHIEPRIGDIVQRHGRRRRGAVRGDRAGAPEVVQRRRLPARRGRGARGRSASGDGAGGRRSSTPGTTSRGSSRRWPRPPARRSPASRTRRGSASCSPPTACRPASLAEGDPYPDELAATAAARRRAARASTRYEFAFQSAGRTGEPWLGPDILDEIRRLAAEGVHRAGDPARRLRRRPPRGPLRHRHRGAGRRPRRLGIRLERARSMNTDPTFIAGLADIAAAALRPATVA